MDITPGNILGHARSGNVQALRAIAREVIKDIIEVNSLVCFTLPANRMSNVVEPAVPAELEARPLTEHELECLTLNPEYKLGPTFLEEFKASKSLAFGLIHEGLIVNYAFYSYEPVKWNGKLRFEYPDGWMYVYKVFTHPDWRGKHLHGYGFNRALQHINECYGAGSRAGFMALVAPWNRASIRSFERIGFGKTLSIHSLLLFGRFLTSFMTPQPYGPRLVVER